MGNIGLSHYNEHQLSLSNNKIHLPIYKESNKSSPCTRFLFLRSRFNHSTKLPYRETLDKIKDLTPNHVCIFPYMPRSSEELEIFCGDNLLLTDNTDPNWWLMESLNSTEKSSKRGYVPSICVAKIGSLESHPWFFPSTTRKESERHLMTPDLPIGTFLIRTSESNHDSLTLSMRDLDEAYGDVVKHFRILNTQDGGFALNVKRPFKQLENLVDFYKTRSCGLPRKLTNACARQRPPLLDLCRSTRDKWEIPRSQIKLCEKVGEGHFGEVWKGLFRDLTTVAIKTVKTGTMTKEDFLKEAKVMKEIQHPKLVKLFAVISNEPIMIITEFMSGGSLLKYLRRDSIRNNLAFTSLLSMISQIALGMKYLEDHSYIHRDLAARNILIAENNEVKIADFGLTRILENNYVYNASEGTSFAVKWTAPEAALKGLFSSKSDVWSFSILIYEILTYGQEPYPAMSNSESLEQVLEGYRMKKPQNCSLDIYKIMTKMWDITPELRPTFNDISNYFDSFNSFICEYEILN